MFFIIQSVEVKCFLAAQVIYLKVKIQNKKIQPGTGPMKNGSASFSKNLF